MEAQKVTKTGATPVEESADEAGKVLGVVETKTVLVNLRDGYGKEMVKLAVVVPGGEVYFLDEAAIKTKPAQAWVKTAVLQKLALKP